MGRALNRAHDWSVDGPMRGRGPAGTENPPCNRDSVERSSTFLCGVSGVMQEQHPCRTVPGSLQRESRTGGLIGHMGQSSHIPSDFTTL